MKEKLERERTKNETLENKINEMERIIVNLINNKNNQETELKIINKNSNKNLNEKNKNESNEEGYKKYKEESNEKDMEKNNVIINERGDLAVVLYNHNISTSGELTL